jgi:hypothetical protein
VPHPHPSIMPTRPDRQYPRSTPAHRVSGTHRACHLPPSARREDCQPASDPPKICQASTDLATRLSTR